MKSIFFPGFILLFFGFTSSQTPDTETASNTLENNSFADLVAANSEEEIRILSDYLAVSSGFYNSEFVETIDIAAGENPSYINLTTAYLKPLQYTVSDVEGIILDRGRFIGAEDLNFSRRREGNYAVYIFAANDVVRAFIVSKNAETVQVF